MIYRHPLTLADAIGEATVDLAERIRESRTAPSWTRSCDMAFACRDLLLADAGPHVGRVPLALRAIADVYGANVAPELTR